MKRLKITKEVGREDIYVSVRTHSDEVLIAQILKQAGENVNERLPRTETHSNLTYTLGKWGYLGVYLTNEKDTKITIAQLAEMLGVEYPLKNDLVKGNWYKRSCNNSLMCFSGYCDCDGDPCGHGLLYGDRWMDADDLGWGGDFIPAIPQEVEDALIEEAKRRYNDGDIINLIVGPYEGKASESGISLKTFDFDMNRNELSCGEETCYTLFKDGIWADVVEESPIGKQKRADRLRELFEYNATILTANNGDRYLRMHHWIKYPADNGEPIMVLRHEFLSHEVHQILKEYKYNATEDLLVGDLIEEAKSKIRKVTTSYPCWIDGERTVNRYCIGHRIESYTEKEAIAQYIKEKVLETL